MATPDLAQIVADMAVAANAARLAYDLSADLSRMALTHSSAARLAVEGGDEPTARQLLAAANAYQDAARRLIELGSQF